MSYAIISYTEDKVARNVEMRFVHFLRCKEIELEKNKIKNNFEYLGTVEFERLFN